MSDFLSQSELESAVDEHAAADLALQRLTADPKKWVGDPSVVRAAADARENNFADYERLIAALKGHVRIRSFEKAVDAYIFKRRQNGGRAQVRDERPVINISPEIHLNADAACEALSKDRTLYQREGELVQIVRVAEPGDECPIGTPQIRSVQLPTLTERLTRVARWQRYDPRTQQYRQRTPTSAVVGAVALRGEWQGVRPVVGVLEAPSLRPDGTAIVEPGYDSATGYLYEPNADYPPAPAEPSQTEAMSALAELNEVWVDFPFATEAARYVPVAALLTILARPAIRGSVPAFVLDASTRGCGKTRTIDAVCTIATGREAPRMTYPPDDAELEKVLASYALRSAAIVAFDNVTSTFGGGPLDRVLTAADRVELRVLGKSEVPALKWRAVVFCNGNNVALGPDTTRRVLVCRLETDMERPEERTGFAHEPLLEWIKEQRPRLVRAALTVLRAYIAAGRPAVDVPQWGSFEAWRALVASAIVYAGGLDVLPCRPTKDGVADPESLALRAILNLWPSFSPEGTTAKTAVESLYPRERLRGEAAPDGWDDLREAIEMIVPTRPGAPPCARRLGYKLRGAKGRVIGGRRLVAATDRNGVVNWRVECLLAGDAGDAGDRFVPVGLFDQIEPQSAGDAGDAGDVSNP